MRKNIEEERANADNPKLRITKDQLRKDWARHKKSTIDRNANIRLAIIITLLVAIFAFVFKIYKLF